MTNSNKSNPIRRLKKIISYILIFIMGLEGFLNTPISIQASQGKLSVDSINDDNTHTLITFEPISEDEAVISFTDQSISEIVQINNANAVKIGAADNLWQIYFSDGNNIFEVVFMQPKSNDNATRSVYLLEYYSILVYTISKQGTYHLGEVDDISIQGNTLKFKFTQPNEYEIKSNNINKSNFYNVRFLGYYLQDIKEIRRRFDPFFKTDLNGNYVLIDYKDIFSDISTLQKPIIRSPQNNTTWDKADLVISWDKVFDSTKYIVNVIDETGKVIVENESVTSTSYAITSDKLEEGKNYSVKVASVSDDGLEFWSDVVKFSIAGNIDVEVDISTVKKSYELFIGESISFEGIVQTKNPAQLMEIVNLVITKDGQELEYNRFRATDLDQNSFNLSQLPNFQATGQFSEVGTYEVELWVKCKGQESKQLDTLIINVSEKEIPKNELPDLGGWYLSYENNFLKIENRYGGNYDKNYVYYPVIYDLAYDELKEPYYIDGERVNPLYYPDGYVKSFESYHVIDKLALTEGNKYFVGIVVFLNGEKVDYRYLGDFTVGETYDSYLTDMDSWVISYDQLKSELIVQNGGITVDRTYRLYVYELIGENNNTYSDVDAYTDDDISHVGIPGSFTNGYYKKWESITSNDSLALNHGRTYKIGIRDVTNAYDSDFYEFITPALDLTSWQINVHGNVLTFNGGATKASGFEYILNVYKGSKLETKKALTSTTDKIHLVNDLGLEEETEYRLELQVNLISNKELNNKKDFGNIISTADLESKLSCKAEYLTNPILANSPVAVKITLTDYKDKSTKRHYKINVLCAYENDNWVSMVEKPIDIEIPANSNSNYIIYSFDFDKAGRVETKIEIYDYQTQKSTEKPTDSIYVSDNAFQNRSWYKISGNFFGEYDTEGYISISEYQDEYIQAYMIVKDLYSNVWKQYEFFNNEWYSTDRQYDSDPLIFENVQDFNPVTGEIDINSLKNTLMEMADIYILNPSELSADEWQMFGFGMIAGLDNSLTFGFGGWIGKNIYNIYLDDFDYAQLEEDYYYVLGRLYVEFMMSAAIMQQVASAAPQIVRSLGTAMSRAAASLPQSGRLIPALAGGDAIGIGALAMPQAIAHTAQGIIVAGITFIATYHINLITSDVKQLAGLKDTMIPNSINAGNYGSPEWKNAVKTLRDKKGKGINIHVKTQEEALKLMKEAGFELELKSTYTSEIYKAGYEIHPAEPSVGNNLQHIKWKNWSSGKANGAEGHIFFGG